MDKPITKGEPVDEMIRHVPGWITRTLAENVEDIAYLSGAALAVLDQSLHQSGETAGLIRQRLALRAAENCVGFTGRMERESDLRDAVHLLRPGDQAGPAGVIYQGWQRAVSRPIALEELQKTVSQVLGTHVPVWFGARAKEPPVCQAAQVLGAVLADFPREEAGALILADAVLARALGWSFCVPLLSVGLRRRDLVLEGDDLRAACYRAISATCEIAVPLAADLSRRVGKLKAVAPKLRAKGATRAVEMFLRTDALSPSVALTGWMSDRAARRLCDRLVALGAVRELTGRATFRLYGV